MRSALVLAGLLALLPGAARAQFGGADPFASDSVGTADGRGNFLSITNRHGAHAYFQATKLTMSGTMIWNVPFDPGTDARATAISSDISGDLVAAGTFRNSDHLAMLVTKFSPDGALSWYRIFEGGGNAIATAVATDRGGSIFVVGTVYEQSGSYLQMVYFDQNGAQLWSQTYRGGQRNYGRGISVDQDGNAVVNVESSSGDSVAGTYRSQKVEFTPTGAVIPLL